MIEFVHCLNSCERLFAVTFGTILAKLVLMRVLVTIRTGFICDPGEFLEFLPVPVACFMTFFTGYLGVPSDDLKLCATVTEF